MKAAIAIFFALVAGGSFAQQYTDAGQLPALIRQADECYQRDDFSGAAVLYMRALRLAEKANDSSAIFRAVFQSGAIQARNGKPMQAIDYMNRALLLAERLDDKTALSNCYMALGAIYISLKKFPEAQTNLDRALKVAESAGDSVSMELCINNLGVLSRNKGNSAEAKRYYERAAQLAAGRGDKKGMIAGYVNVGGCYLRMNEPVKALELYHEAERLTGETNSLQLKQQVSEALAEAYAHQHNYEKALSYYKKQSLLKDSLFNIASNAKIEELNSLYQAEKKLKEIIQLKSDNQEKEMQLSESRNELDKRTFILALLAIVLALAAVFGFVLFRQYRLKERINASLARKNREISEQKQQLEENLAYTRRLQEALQHDLNHYMQLALGKQMNPHFIFNSLNSIQSFILQNDKLSASLYLSRFSELMRKVLQNSQHEFITIEEELGTLQLYVELEQKRFGNRFDFSVKVEEDINPRYFLVPPLMLQPYIENAIWHGLMHKEGAGSLELVLKKEKETIIFSVTDNGVGREEAARRKQVKDSSRESLGTKITARRLELISFLNNTNIKVNYTDLKDERGNGAGTRVTIVVPVMSAFRQKNIPDESSNN